MLDLIDFNPLECFHSEFHNGENVDRYPREPNNFLRKFIWTRLHLGHEISYILGLIRRRIINYRKIAPRWFPILITPGKSMDSKGISRLYMSFQEFCRSIQAWWNEEPMQWLFSSVSFREFGPLKSWSTLSFLVFILIGVTECVWRHIFFSLNSFPSCLNWMLHCFFTSTLQIEGFIETLFEVKKLFPEYLKSMIRCHSYSTRHWMGYINFYKLIFSTPIELKLLNRIANSYPT